MGRRGSDVAVGMGPATEDEGVLVGEMSPVGVHQAGTSGSPEAIGHRTERVHGVGVERTAEAGVAAGDAEGRITREAQSDSGELRYDRKAAVDVDEVRLGTGAPFTVRSRLDRS